MRTEPNEPINSVVEDNNYEGQLIRECHYLGLTKREHFASMAMQGYRASCPDKSAEFIAYESVADADALIAALNQQAKKDN